MPSSPTIHFLRHKEIDPARWDECVSSSVSPLVYAKTFYLDHIAAAWDGLVGENYDWVMPLTWRKKFGIRYLYQPAFTQQLGTFAKPGIVVPYKRIIQYLQGRFRFCEINWNYSAPPLLSSLPVTIHPATNFILDLSAKYDGIAARYHDSLKKSLKKAAAFQQYYNWSDDFNARIEMYKKYYGKRIPHVTEADYRNFSRICFNLNHAGSLVSRLATNARGTILASILLLLDGKRMYNIMNTTTEAGRTTLANHFLLDRIIREFAATGLLLDFEGSDLPGVRAFYTRFGAVDQPYFQCRYNCLPGPLKMLKG
jgi:hypothetical protein